MFWLSYFMATPFPLIPPPPLSTINCKNLKNIYMYVSITVEDWYNHQISNLLQKKQRKQNNEQM